MFIEWSDALSCNEPEIDKQHQSLVGIVNELSESVDNGSDREIIGALLNKLSYYTHTHFAYEEEWMRKMGYPDLKQHKKKHFELMMEVFKYHSMITGPKTLSPVVVLDFLKTWLVGHIQGDDQKAAQYAASNLNPNR